MVAPTYDIDDEGRRRLTAIPDASEPTGPGGRYRHGEECPVCRDAGRGGHGSRCKRKPARDGRGFVYFCRNEGDVPGWIRLRRTSEGGVPGAIYRRDDRDDRQHEPTDWTPPEPVEDRTVPPIEAERILECTWDLIGEDATDPDRRAVLERELHQRGIPADPRLYRQAPTEAEARRIGARIAERFPVVADPDRPIPGYPFRDRDTRPTVAVRHWTDPILLAVLDADGRVRGWHERATTNADPKYLHRLGAVPHWAINWRVRLGATGTLAVCEGTFKANETARRCGFGAVAVPSVGFGHAIATEIERTALAAAPDAAPWTVYFVTDVLDLVNGNRDDTPRNAVLRDWKRLAERFEEAGATVGWLFWDTDRLGKGFDDALQALGWCGDGLPPEVEVLRWPEFYRRWRWKDSPPKPKTLPPLRTDVRGIGEARAEAEAILRAAILAVAPNRSLYLASPPGLGKTSATLRVAVDYAKAGGTTALALPTRDLVAEKADALRRDAAEAGVQVQVVELVGASSDPMESGYCADSGRRAELAADWLDSACRDCPHFEACDSTPGSYRHDRRELRETIANGPTIVIATLDALNAELAHPDCTIPPTARIVADDCGSTFGVLGEITAKIDKVQDGRGRLRGTRDGRQARRTWASQDHVPDNIPPALVEVEAIAPVLRWLAEDRTRKGLQRIVAEMQTDLRDALTRSWPSYPDRAAEDRAPGDPLGGWSWRLVGRILSPALRGSLPTADIDGQRITVHVPRMALIDAAREGRMVWLGVPPMPAPIAEALNVHVQRVEVEAPGLSIVAVRGPWSLGLPDKVDRRRKRHEAVVGFVSALEARAAGAPNGLNVYGLRIGEDGPPAVCSITPKADAEVLGDAERFGHWGKHERSTDAFADADLLVLAHWSPPEAETYRIAVRLAAALGLPEPKGGPDAIDLVQVRWSPDSHDEEVRRFRDPLVRAVQDFEEADRWENAVGRCRPFGSKGHRITKRRIVLVLASRPRADLEADLVLDHRELIADLALDLREPENGNDIENDRRRAKAEADDAEAAEDFARVAEGCDELPTVAELLERTGRDLKRQAERWRRVEESRRKARTLSRTTLVSTPLQASCAKVSGGSPTDSELARMLEGNPYLPPDFHSRRKAVGRIRQALEDYWSGGPEPRHRTERLEAVARALETFRSVETPKVAVAVQIPVEVPQRHAIEPVVLYASASGPAITIGGRARATIVRPPPGDGDLVGARTVPELGSTEAAELDRRLIVEARNAALARASAESLRCLMERFQRDRAG